MVYCCAVLDTYSREDRRRSLQIFVGPLRLAVLLLERLDPRRLRSAHPRRMPSSMSPWRPPDCTDSNRPLFGADLGPKRTQHPHRCDLSSGLSRCVVGFPGDCSLGTTPSSFARLASKQSRRSRRIAVGIYD